MIPDAMTLKWRQYNIELDIQCSRKYAHVWVLLYASINSYGFTWEESTDHDDVKWKHFSRYWHFVRGIHRCIPLTKASHAELWCFLWSASEHWVNNRYAGDLKRHRTLYDVIVKCYVIFVHKDPETPRTFPLVTSSCVGTCISSATEVTLVDT